MPDLEGVKIAVLGGDARQVVLVKCLAEKGAQVITVGIPEIRAAGITSVDDPVRAVKDIDAAIFPMQGINQKGEVFSKFKEKPPIYVENFISTVPQGILLYTGVACFGLEEMARRRGIKVVELNKIDELAVLNSIPTAEGAIQIAMEKLPITIHGSSAFVCGFGRTGTTLARALDGLGANVFVVARNPAQLARAVEMGLHSLPFSQFEENAGQADVIFNTVPALVIKREILKNLKKDCLIVDIASAPGGTDFESAKELGIQSILALGLPGKVAPVTSGRMLASVITRLLLEEKCASAGTRFVVQKNLDCE